MNRYRFIIEKWETPTSSTSTKIEVINYKCLICGTTFEWDDTRDTEKKEEVKLEEESGNFDFMRGLSSGVSLLGGGIGDILETDGTEEANNAKLEPKMNIKKLLDIFEEDILFNLL